MSKAAATKADPTPPVVEIVLVDPGDAGGVGNSTERTIAPGTLHETAEEARARGSAWRPI